MRPGEWRRQLYEEQGRAALAGRQWHVQRHFDIGMSGADEFDELRRFVPGWQREAIRIASTGFRLPAPWPLSAHWWHG